MNTETVNTIVSDLEGMKLITNTGDLSYSNDRWGYPNIIFKNSDEFKEYISNFQDENKLIDDYDSPEVEDFLVNLGLIYDKYGYDITNDISSDGTIYIEPINDVKEIIKNYNDYMDLSKIGRKRIRIGDYNITVGQLLNNDVFIDNTIKDKFVNAVSAVMDIVNYLSKFETERNLTGIYFLNDLYYMPKFKNFTDINNVRLSELTTTSNYLYKNKTVQYTEKEKETLDIIRNYILVRFKELANQYLPNLKSLSNVHTIKNLDKDGFVVQLETFFNKANLNSINNVMHEYL